jgi:hypothetical protein
VTKSSAKITRAVQWHFITTLVIPRDQSHNGVEGLDRGIQLAAAIRCRNKCYVVELKTAAG